ncbi:MAG: hypothetical protein AVDCRST_MAG59-1232, partial [uncultured Thermomicrobiales bacterium]
GARSRFRSAQEVERHRGRRGLRLRHSGGSASVPGTERNGL